MSKQIQVFIFILFIISSDVFSQPFQRTWVQTYDNDSVQARFEIVKTGVDSHNNLFVLSRRDTGTYQPTILLTKYDASGVKIWDRYYLNPNLHYDVIPVDLSIDAYDNIIVGGNEFVTGEQGDYLILKYDGNGNLLWHRTVDGTEGKDDLLLAVKTDNAGNIFVTGTSQVSGDPYYYQDVMSCKFDSLGNRIWLSYFEYPTILDPSNYPLLFTIDSHSNLIITGGLGNNNVAKYDSSGTLLWQSRYELYYANAVIAGENDNIYLAGSDPSGSVLEKLNSNGSFIRNANAPLPSANTLSNLIFHNNKIYGTGITGNPTTSALIICTDTTFGSMVYDTVSIANVNVNGIQIAESGGKYFVSGKSTSTSSHYDIFAARYDSTLQRMWTFTYTDSLNHNTQFIHSSIGNHGELFIGSTMKIAGFTYSVIAVDSNGNDSWHDVRLNYQSSYDEGKLITHDRAGNIIVCGTSGGMQSNGIVLKYDPSGNLLWKFQSPSPYGTVFPSQLMTDSVNNIYICGFSAKPTLMCIDPSGSLLFTTIDTSVIQFSSMALDNAGNIYLMAPTHSSVNYTQLLKIDHAGNILWKKILSDSSYCNGNENLFFASSNSIYAVYTSNGIPSHQQDIGVAKLDTAGNILWKTHFNSGASQLDLDQRAVLDPFENIIVAGISDSLSWETMVIKYDSSGNLLWQNRFENYSNGWNEPSDVVTDASGNIYVTGRSDTLLGHTMCLTSMITPNGTVKWSDRYYTVFTSGVAIAYDEGNLIITGSNFDFNSRSNILFLIYDTAGTILYVDTITSAGGINSNIGNDIMATGNGCYYLTGYTDTYLKMSQLTTVKYCNLTASTGKEVDENDLIVYPVPTQQQLHVSSSQKIISSYEIFSTEGKLISKKTINASDAILELQLSPGIYFLKVLSGDNVYTKKISIVF